MHNEVYRLFSWQPIWQEISCRNTGDPNDTYEGIVVCGVDRLCHTDKAKTFYVLLVIPVFASIWLS